MMPSVLIVILLLHVASFLWQDVLSLSDGSNRCNCKSITSIQQHQSYVTLFPHQSKLHKKDVYESSSSLRPWEGQGADDDRDDGDFADLALLILTIRGGGSEQEEDDNNDYNPNYYYGEDPNQQQALYTPASSTTTTTPPPPPQEAFLYQPNDDDDDNVDYYTNNQNHNKNYENGFGNNDPLHSQQQQQQDQHLQQAHLQQEQQQQLFPFDFPERVFHESVQDRVDQWRSIQMEKYEHRTLEQEANPRDEYGRAKLFVQVSKAARYIVFLLFVFRDMHLLDVAVGGGVGITIQQFIRSVLMILLIGNMASVVASFTTPGHSTKKRMKLIMNCNKVVECILLLWCFVRLTLAVTPHIPRDIYFASMFHSLFFLSQAQAITRLTWDDGVSAPSGSATIPHPSKTSTATTNNDNNNNNNIHNAYEELRPIPSHHLQDTPQTMYASNNPPPTGY